MVVDCVIVSSSGSSPPSPSPRRGERKSPQRRGEGRYASQYQSLIVQNREVAGLALGDDQALVMPQASSGTPSQRCGTSVASSSWNSS